MDASEENKLTGKSTGLQKPTYLVNFFEIAFDAIVALDSQKQITFWNLAAGRMYGWTADEALGKTPAELFWPVDTDQEREAQSQRQMRLERGETIQGEHSPCRKDGSLFWVEYTMRAIIDGQGGISGYATVYRDITERKRAENDIRLISRIPGENPNPVVRLGLDGQVLFANAAAGPILDSWKQKSGRSIPDELQQFISDAFAGDSKKQFEIEQDGRAFSFTMAPIRDAGYVNLYGSDITERKQTEEALRQSEERFARFMQHLPGLAWIKDVQGRYMYANAAAERAFGTPREKLYGRTDQELFPAEVAAQFKQNDERALTEGKGVQVIETLPHDDGLLHYSLVSKFPIPGPDGNTGLIGGTAFDITDHRRTEGELRASEERFRTLANAMPSIVWTAAPDGTILYSNDQWYEFTGISPERNARDWPVVLHPDDYERCVREWTHALETVPDEYLIEVRNRRHDGQYRWFQTRAMPVRDETGKVTAWYGVTTDIHDRITVEDMLREREKQLQVLNETLEQKVREQTAEVRRLASDLTKAEQRERHRISHILHDDLQQRLYAIQMHMAFLGGGLEIGNEVVEKDLAEIKEQLDEVLALTRHLSIDLSPPILDDEGLSQAIAWLASQMQEQHGLDIELQAEKSFAIPDKDLQVLLFNCVRELLFNVVKHAGVSQAVVALQWSEAGLRIEVRDQGKGLDVKAPEQSVLNRVGEHEVERASFGLPTIRHQLSLFGGSMDISSEPGAGTQVTLIIPVYEEGPAAGEPQRE